MIYSKGTTFEIIERDDSTGYLVSICDPREEAVLVVDGFPSKADARKWIKKEEKDVCAE